MAAEALGGAAVRLADGGTNWRERDNSWSAALPDCRLHRMASPDEGGQAKQNNNSKGLATTALTPRQARLLTQVSLPPNQWCAPKRVRPRRGGRQAERLLTRSICKAPWCKYPHLGPLEATSKMLLNVALMRDTQ